MSFPNDLIYFKREEFKNPDLMSVSFLRWLDRIRGWSGVPIIITSDARTPESNVAASGSSKTSLHLRGMAVDFKYPLTVVSAWKLAAAIFYLAEEAPGKVGFELVYSEKDKHVHLGVDDGMSKDHELIVRAD